MKMPPKTSGSELLLRKYGIYHLSRLKAREETKQQASAFGKIQTDLEKKYFDRLEKEEASDIITGKMNWAEYELYNAIRKFSFTLLSLHHNNRKAMEYQKYFPEGLSLYSSLTNQKGKDALAFLFHQIEKEENEFIAEFKTELEEKRTAFSEAQKEKEEAELVTDKSFIEEVESRTKWLYAYRSNQLSLLQIYQHDKRAVDVFFRKLKKKPKKEEKVDEVKEAKKEETPPAK